MWSEASCSDYVLTPVLIRGLSRTPRLRPTVFRADLLRARPPPFDSFMVSSSAHSAQPDDRRRTPRTPPQVLPLRPARALSLCVFSPHPGLGGRWAQRSMGGGPFPPPGSVAPGRGRRGSGTFSTSHECPPGETPTLHPRPFRPLFFLLCCPVGRGTASHGIRPTSPRSRTRLLVSPVPSSPPGATVGPASPIFTPRCPVLLSTARRLLNQP